MDAGTNTRRSARGEAPETTRAPGAAGGIDPTGGTERRRSRGPAPSASRLGAWLAALSPIAYAVVVAAMAGVFANIGVGSFDSITREQMDALGAGWAIARVLVAAASIVVAVGAGLLALDVARRRGGVRAARICAGASVALAGVNALTAIADAVNGVALGGFTTARLGDDPRWAASAALLPWLFGAAVAQLALLAWALRLSRILPVAGLVVGLLAVVVLVAVVLAAGLVPPFVLALLACPLGIAWLRATRRAASMTP